MLLIGTQDSEEETDVLGKNCYREHRKSNVVVVFENATGAVVFESAYKNEELWDSTTPGICCVKGDLRATLLASSRGSKGVGH